MIETFFHPHLGLSPSGPADRAVVATITSDPMIRERAAAIAQRMRAPDESGPAAIARACDALLSLAKG